MSEDLWVTTERRGGHRSGVPFLLQPFQLSPSTLVTIYEHDLPTLQLPHSALGANLSRPPTTSNQPSVPLWPSDPQHIPHLDKTNLMSHMQKQTRIMYVRIRAQMHTHTLTHKIRSPAFTLRGQWLFFSTGSKVSNKKIQYSKCTGSPAYQYIIQKGDRWQAIRRWKAIEFSVSRYLWMHQSAAVDNWIKKETWLTSSSKKPELPAIWRLETLMGFFGSKNYLWHLRSSASCLHFN